VLIAFFLLTFAASWSCYFAAAMAAPAGAASSPLATTLLSAGTFAPSLVAIATTAASGGRAGVASLLAPVFLWDARVRWYAFAVGYMAAIKLAAAVVHRAIAGTWPQSGEIPWYLALAAVIVSTPVQAGEEIGWRAYALPRLLTRMGFLRGNIVLGVVWAAWHLPLFFMPGVDLYRQSFWLFLLAVTPLSVAMGWLYVQTGGSVLLTMVMHSAVNQTTLVVSAGGPAATTPFTMSAPPFSWTTIALLWIGAAYFARTRVSAASAACSEASLPW
jgi:uncharacterized protein